jgi:hypothetical protein
MLDLEQLQILGQLVDNIGRMESKFEKAFETNNGEEFVNSKKEILKVQKEIKKMIDIK